MILLLPRLDLNPMDLLLLSVGISCLGGEKVLLSCSCHAGLLCRSSDQCDITVVFILVLFIRQGCILRYLVAHPQCRFHNLFLAGSPSEPLMFQTEFGHVTKMHSQIVRLNHHRGGMDASGRPLRTQIVREVVGRVVEEGILAIGVERRGIIVARFAMRFIHHGCQVL